MGMRQGAAVLALAAATAISLAVPAAGEARSKPRPDLVVSKGSVREVNGKLSGSFVIQNAGRKGAGRSTAALTVTAARKKQVVKRFSLGSLRRSKSVTQAISVEVPAGLPAGSLPLKACADSGGNVRERSERNNCLRVGTLAVAGAGPGTPTPEPTPAPASSVPTDPVPFNKGEVFTLQSSETNYWTYVPSAYDSSHQTPMTLFVWLHGCGGESSGDIYNASPGGAQDWISIAVGGREGDCWDPPNDQAKVLAAVANVKSHFNINPHRVILGGYSSGGDLAYRTAFYNANTFAGVLAENTSPFRDTGSSQSESLAAAAWKFNVVHLAHTEDGTYPIDGVRQEIQAMTGAGFPATLIEKPGAHYDAQTNSDLQTYLLPHIDDGWLSP